jgi:hypothetical protein
MRITTPPVSAAGLRLGAAILFLTVGCASGDDGFSSGGSGGDGGSGGQAAGGGGAGGGGGEGGLDVGGQGGSTDLVAEVFGHSASTLFRLDPDTKAVTVVGDFSGCIDVLDIALDKDSFIFGSTDEGLYRIDKFTAACTLVAPGAYPNSLSFVPAGTVDPNSEALVGYLDETYVRIDKTTGAITPVGSLTGGLVSSGDIVSVKGGSTYLTVTGPSCDDCLVEVDPATGAQIKMWGQIGYENVFGIAFWAGAIYGFTSFGEMFEVTLDGGFLQTAAIPTAGGLSFWGAGSTTSAPPTPIAE